MSEMYAKARNWFTPQMLVAFAIFAVQIPVSAWWLNRHTYGPLEWLLRAFTNWSIPAWRKQGSL